MYRSHGDGGRSTRLLATVATAVALAACSESSDDADTPREAGSMLDATADVSGDAGVTDQNAPDATDTSLMDSPATTCRLLSSGKCSPAPDSTQSECNGCYDVAGQVYDTALGCLRDLVPKVLACTVVCSGGAAGECYSRPDGGTSEVILSVSTYYDNEAAFEVDTGFTVCDESLRNTVITAVPCGE